MSDFSHARTAMIEGQLRTNKITDARVLERFSTVPREAFVPSPFKGTAYVDEDFSLSGGRVFLEPMLAARMVQEADLNPLTRLLLIGDSTGYLATITLPLAAMVVTVESNEHTKNLQAQFAGVDRAVVVTGEIPLLGAPDYAPYDAIIVNGGTADIPATLLEQLSENGHLIAIVRKENAAIGQLVRASKTGAITILADASTPYLGEAKPVEKFKL